MHFKTHWLSCRKRIQRLRRIFRPRRESNWIYSQHWERLVVNWKLKIVRELRLNFCNFNNNRKLFLDYLRNKDRQLEELEAKTAQLLAVMPVDTHFQMNSMAMTSSPSNMDHHHHHHHQQPDTFAG